MQISSNCYYNIPIHEITKSTAEDELLRLRKVWRAGVNQLFVDAFSKSKKTTSIKLKKEARSFVRMNNRSFINMCEIAYLDPRKVYESFKKIERGQLELID